eukprot:CAMPEP_0183747860 /NCGR_PEP_ID=MMETSP0737-20130205/67475_1 /TAXON_ID=385413 /ORGANISM="Thalassiosira miniscula, Strain CCMP1093" /LENGTH=1235 /DNA_ID=CAMNT_0025983577 /DNA_START=84 /DNA_END=3791 /DNA_ORIENTATION=+
MPRAASKKTSTSQTTLEDGTQIEQVIEETTSPDGTKVKAIRKKKILPNGSVTESTKTTTTREPSSSVHDRATTPSSEIMQAAAGVVGSFMDVFSHSSCDASSMGTGANLQNGTKGRQQTRQLSRQRSRQPREQREDDDMDSFDMSMLSMDTTLKRRERWQQQQLNLRDHSNGMRQLPYQQQLYRNQNPYQQWEDERRGYQSNNLYQEPYPQQQQPFRDTAISTESISATAISTKSIPAAAISTKSILAPILSATSSTGELSDPRRDQPPPIQQIQTKNKSKSKRRSVTTTRAAAVAASHPGYNNNGNNNGDIRDFNTNFNTNLDTNGYSCNDGDHYENNGKPTYGHSSNNLNNQYYQGTEASTLNADTLTHNGEDDETLNTMLSWRFTITTQGTEASTLNADTLARDDDDDETLNTMRELALYDNDRWEQQQPVFHKVKNDSPNSRGGGNDAKKKMNSSPGRSMMRSFGNAAKKNNASSNNSPSNNGSNGTNNSARSMKLGISSLSRSPRQTNNSPDGKDLDPEVANAIASMRNVMGSKSPSIGDRRKKMRQRIKLKQQQQQQQSRQPSPMRGQSSPMQQQKQQRQPSPARTPVSPSSPRTENYNINSRQASPSAKFRQQQQAYGTSDNSRLVQSAPSTPSGAGTGAGTADFSNNRKSVNFNVHPLGHIAQPIHWNDEDTRGDRPSGNAMGRSPGNISSGASVPQSPGLPPRSPGGGLLRNIRGRSTMSLPGMQGSPSGQRSALSQKNLLPPPTITKKSSKNTTLPKIPPATLVDYDQALLPTNNSTTKTIGSDPKIAIYKNNAIITSQNYVHFYSFNNNSDKNNNHNQWVKTTTVSLQSNHHLSLALSKDTAVIGVPYDRNSRGVLTGSAYIFERDARTNTWYQVKKIVPKSASEHAAVGYSVEICNDIVVLGVPESGTSLTTLNGVAAPKGGSVYLYRRTMKIKWNLMGHLTLDNGNAVDELSSPTGGQLSAPPITRFGSIVAMRGKILVVSNYQPNNYSKITSLFVYEYDAKVRNKWRLIQTDLLSMEGQKRHFGSRIALTNDGEGIFVGSHSSVSPTEILYYKRSTELDGHGNRSYQLQQIITIQEQCSISSFMVDEQNGNLILGTLKSNNIYVFQQLYDLNTMQDRGWNMVCKVVNNEKGSKSSKNGNCSIERFGSNVGLFGDAVLVGSKNNVYSYSLEGWKDAASKKKKKKGIIKASKSSSSTVRSSSPGKRFISSMSPMRLRRSSSFK